MKITEADEGASVIYTPGYGVREVGRVVRRSGDYVFVDYHGSIKATHPGDLELLNVWAPC